MPFEIFTADHNTTLSQVASLSRMNLRSPYTDAILADSDVPTYAMAMISDIKFKPGFSVESCPLALLPVN